jgi:putative nuclease YbcO-like protein
MVEAMILNPHMLPKVRSDLIMASAAGEPCSLRISSFCPGHSCSGTNTTIGAHLPVFGKGFNSKVTDTAVAFACYNCHLILDGVDKARSDFITENYSTALMERLLNGLVETHLRLIMAGVIVISDGRMV